MNLKVLSDKTLLENTEQLVKRERELLSEILHHLREIESRRLFSDLGFKSLWDYVTKHLGYSEDQAARRISAMRLLRDLPEIESQISNGSLSLTNISQAQSLFRMHKKNSNELSRDKKLELLEQITNKSKRQAEVIIARQNCNPINSDLDPRAFDQNTLNTIEIYFRADLGLQNKIEKVKGLIAHSRPGLSMAELMNYLCDLAIQKLDPAQKIGGVKRSSTRDKAIASQLPAPEQVATLKRDYIPTATRQAVWQKAQSCCENCKSKYALQIEHIQPIAKGGGNNIENLKLLCRTCNQRSAIKNFGAEKMRKWLAG